MPDGWRVIAGSGAVRCVLVEGQPALPHQRGALYGLSAEGGVSLKVQRSAWLTLGLMQAGGTFEEWPGSKPTACGSCSKACACGPCRVRHAHAPDSEPVD